MPYSWVVKMLPFFLRLRFALITIVSRVQHLRVVCFPHYCSTYNSVNFFQICVIAWLCLCDLVHLFLVVPVSFSFLVPEGRAAMFAFDR